MGDGGKGSKRRPQAVTDDVFWKNFDRIFGTEEPEPKKYEESCPSDSKPLKDIQENPVK